jgi:hypothetical protein
MAEHRGPVEFARIGTLQALNRYAVRVFTSVAGNALGAGNRRGTNDRSGTSRFAPQIVVEPSGVNRRPILAG